MSTVIGARADLRSTSQSGGRPLSRSASVGGLQAAELRRHPTLCDPFRVARALDLEDGAIRQGSRGLTVRCFAHADRRPSLSISTGPDGTLRVHCFGPCDLSGDIFSLVAAVHRLDPRRDFVAVLDRVASLAGSIPDASIPRALRTYAAPTYPPSAEVAALWAAAKRVTDVPAVAVWCRSRPLDPGEIEDRDLARALPDVADLPPWAATRRATWIRSGHRLLLPLFDRDGNLRSLRARRVVDGDSPKVLAPRGCMTSHLVMACPGALSILRGRKPLWTDDAPAVVVAEGDADYLTWATHYSDADEMAPVVLGVFSGAWSPAVAARIPAGACVALRTDRDATGDKYATEIAEDLAHAAVFR